MEFLKYAEQKFKTEKKEKSVFGNILKDTKSKMTNLTHKILQHESSGVHAEATPQNTHGGESKLARQESRQFEDKVKKRVSIMMGQKKHYAVEEDQLQTVKRKKSKKKRTHSVCYLDDLSSIEAKVNFFRREIFDQKFRNLSPRVKKLLKNYYDELIAKRAKYREKMQKKADLGKSIRKGQKKIKGFGPWDLLWEFKAEAIKKESPYNEMPSYNLRQIIVKGGDDLRQEIIAMQLIKLFQIIFKKESSLSIFLRTYEIVVINSSSGIIEFIPDSISIDALKKKYSGLSLKEIFKLLFGFNFEEAQKNFVESLAGYSLIMYLLQVKDR